ncbi:squalene/phytoene synthase family protein [Microtetraspora malaysiensis]|uniref:squalene/phytoene synthase family protein n=1 Tax=Microtetraspora malaysiensis TaxID=161358 RepID=UPI003D8FE9D7
MGVPEAYQHCEQIMRRNARNFSYGLRLLPAPKRRALSAVYAFARRIDDIADGHGPAGARLARLNAARRRWTARRARARTGTRTSYWSRCTTPRGATRCRSPRSAS